MTASGLRSPVQPEPPVGACDNVVPIAEGRGGTQRTVLLAWTPGAERDVLVERLRQRRHRVQVADDTLAALHLIESAPWQAIVLEDELPAEGGLWVAKLLAFADAERSDARGPLILVGHDAHDDEWHATAVSVQLAKPVTAGALVSAIALACRRGRAYG